MEKDNQFRDAETGISTEKRKLNDDCPARERIKGQLQSWKAQAAKRRKLNRKSKKEVSSVSWLQKLFAERDCGFANYFKKEVCDYLDDSDCCNLRLANVDISGIMFEVKVREKYWSGVLRKCHQLFDFFHNSGSILWELKVEAEQFMTDDASTPEDSIEMLLWLNRKHLNSLSLKLPKQQSAEHIDVEFGLCGVIDLCKKLAVLHFENFYNIESNPLPTSLQLEMLVFKNCIKIWNIDWIDFSKMKSFTIDQDEDVEYGSCLCRIDHLRTAHNLVELRIFQQDTLPDLSPILALKNLQELSIAQTCFDSINSFEPLSQLRELHIEDFPEDDIFGEEDFFKDHHARTLPASLEILTIEQCKLKDFSFLQTFSNLKKLHITEAKLTDDDLNFCNPGLEVLGLFGCDNITDWQAINARFTKLSEISFSSKDQTEHDRILPILSSLPYLTTINDAGIEARLTRDQQSCDWKLMSFEDYLRSCRNKVFHDYTESFVCSCRCGHRITPPGDLALMGMFIHMFRFCQGGFLRIHSEYT